MQKYRFYQIGVAKQNKDDATLAKIATVLCHDFFECLSKDGQHGNYY